MKLAYIVQVGGWITNSAGVYCIYRLAHELRQRGIDAYTHGGGSHPPEPWGTPSLSTAEATAMCSSGQAIAVYAESIDGNPIRANHIARWVLNRPGFIGGPKTYGPTESIWTYSDFYSPYITEHIDGKLHLPTIDRSIFYPPAKECRTEECFYVGKSKWRDGLFGRNGKAEITRTQPPKNTLGDLFRRSRLLYCFDNSTILAYEALMCGCPVAIVPDGTHTLEDYRHIELGMDGIAWGVDDAEIERAKRSLNPWAMQERCDQLDADFQEQLSRFIEVTEGFAA